MKKNPITVTPKALERLQFLIKKREKPPIGIRIGLKTKGCSGLSYTLEYADGEYPYDEIVELKDVKLLIDSKAILFIIGTEMDFVEEKLQSGFVFKNPQEKGKCGCGKSFHV